MIRFDLPGRPPPISIEAVLALLPVQPYASSRIRSWPGVTVDLCPAVPDCSVSVAALDHHAVYYCSGGRERLFQGRAGAVHDGKISAGMSLLMPAGYDSTWEGFVPASARLRIPTALVDAAADQAGAPVRVELRNVFETRDPVLERLSLILMNELDVPSHPTQALIVESISCALAGHLVRSYNAFEPAEHVDRGAFSRAELARINSYIDDHLEGAISLDDLAGLVRVSRFHFTRLFKRSTGSSAIAFVEQARLRHAQALISGTDLPLAEVALRTGFADQSHFTRRFHRHVGCTPAVFARVQGRRRFARRLVG